MKHNKIKPSDITGINDISLFPILDKPTVNSHIKELTATNYKKNQIRYESTGGTTGKPVTFGRDKLNEFLVDANNWRLWKYAHYEIGMSVALFWGNEIELVQSDSIHDKMKRTMENTEILNFYDFSFDRFIAYTKFIQDTKPEIIRGFGTAVFLFIQYCQENKIKLGYRPRSIILTSEKIYPEQKKKISDYFECEVFEEYGCREFSLLGHECSEHRGLHLSEELFLFEVLNPTGSEAKLSGTGEILVTPFFNYAMPLLRYHLGDEVKISTEDCPCGRSLKLISEIQGRITDYVVTKSGKLIHGDMFAHVMFSIQGIIQYQVVQNKEGLVQIKIVKGGDYSLRNNDKIMEDLKKMYGNDLESSIQFVDEITVSQSGKRRSVISRVAPDYLMTLNG